MDRHRVLFTDAPWGDLEIERELLESNDCDLLLAPSTDESALTKLVQDVSAIATCWAPVTAAVIEAAQDCQVIARMGIGLDNIDIPAATARRITVTHVPDYCVEEVAAHALGLLLAHARRIALFHQQTKQGVYDLQSARTIRRLSGQTLGLIGFGRIARRLREMALGLGLSVVAHTPSGNDYGTGCPMVSLDELLASSDYISLHAPHTDLSHHLIDASALSKLRPWAFLINTSRGGLVDHQALAEALQQDRLAGAGLDVFEPEPPDLSLPLFRDERVIASPHAAFVSQESLVELRSRVARQILDVLSGRIPEHVVNS